MTKFNFKPVPKDHEFKEGDIISLGGRVGEVEEIQHGPTPCRVSWEDAPGHVTSNYLDLSAFLEVLLHVSKPKISKEARDCILDNVPILKGGSTLVSRIRLMQVLDSITE